MTPIEFVAALRSEVIASNQRHREQWFRTAVPAKVCKPDARRALELFASLPPEQQVVFFEILRQTAVDTMSNVLGILDGSSYLAPTAPLLVLSTTNGAKLSGDLQDFFLAAEEDDPAA